MDQMKGGVGGQSASENGFFKNNVIYLMQNGII
jgi:hypothetical protein